MTPLYGTRVQKTSITAETLSLQQVVQMVMINNLRLKFASELRNSQMCSLIACGGHVRVPIQMGARPPIFLHGALSRTSRVRRVCEWKMQHLLSMSVAYYGISRHLTGMAKPSK